MALEEGLGEVTMTLCVTWSSDATRSSLKARGQQAICASTSWVVRDGWCWGCGSRSRGDDEVMEPPCADGGRGRACKVGWLSGGEDMGGEEEGAMWFPLNDELRVNNPKGLFGTRKKISCSCVFPVKLNRFL
jgi:hypothetical protein